MTVCVLSARPPGYVLSVSLRGAARCSMKPSTAITVIVIFLDAEQATIFHHRTPYMCFSFRFLRER